MSLTSTDVLNWDIWQQAATTEMKSALSAHEKATTTKIAQKKLNCVQIALENFQQSQDFIHQSN